MISGRLQEKNGYYYMILNLKDENGRYKPKWMKTGLTIRGNKKNAEGILKATIARIETEERERGIVSTDNPLFSEYMVSWLTGRKKCIQPNTYTAYRAIIMERIVPYFEKYNVRLLDLKPEDITAYYQFLMEERGNGANSVKHHHANIRKALNQAFVLGKIPGNPADKVELPRDEECFRGDFYDADEIGELLKASRGHKLELAILIAAYYGLRRSEVLGLKWQAVNFKQKSITISHVVCEVVDDKGKRFILGKEKTKNLTSLRTLPLMPVVEEALLQHRGRLKRQQKLLGSSYSKNNLSYVFLDELGEIMKPNYVSQSFKQLLLKNELRSIRFHDLRHSCAILLLASGVDLKRIQEWLGHASIETTSKYYGHLKFDSKIESAEIIQNSLRL